jgi:hypothetical protein
MEDKIRKAIKEQIKKLKEATGIKKVVNKITGDKDCGCNKRKEILNKIVPYKKTRIKLTDLL